MKIVVEMSSKYIFWQYSFVYKSTDVYDLKMSFPFHRSLKFVLKLFLEKKKSTKENSFFDEILENFFLSFSN